MKGTDNVRMVPEKRFKKKRDKRSPRIPPSSFFLVKYDQKSIQYSIH
jgi:hypothetical protein